MIHALVFAVSISVTVLRAFVINILFGWFVTPAFGLEVPSLAATIGVLFLISLITTKRADLEDMDIKVEISHGLISPFIYLAICFPFSFFV